MTRERHADLRPSPAACEWLVEALSPDALHEAVRGLGREIGELIPGFTLSHKTLTRHSVRTLLARSLGRHPLLTGRICLSPTAPWQPWRKVLDLLDEPWLLDHWRPLCRHYGPALAVAMCLDEREDICDRGERLLKLTAFWREAYPRPAVLPPGWNELLHLLAPPPVVLPAPPPPEPKAPPREPADRWKRKCQEAEAKAEQTEKRLREEIRRLRQEYKDKETELDQLRESFEQRLRAEVGNLRNHLLAPAPAAPGSNGTIPLAEQAEHILQRQEALDQQRGTRSELRAEIERLEELEKRLRRCLGESLVLVPELTETSQRVGQRLHEARAILGDMDMDSEAPDLAAALFGRLKAAVQTKDAGPELDQIRHLLDQDMVRGLLGPGQHARLDQLERVHRQEIANRLIETALPEPSPAGPRDREVWNVAERLACYPAPAVWLFVDGYNTILGVPDLHRIEQEQGLAAARNHFLALCRRQAHRFAHFEVVFDGADTTATTENGSGLRVVYSRASRDSQNADDHLVRRLHDLRPQAGICWLVTDDYGLRERVREVCDAFVPPVLFHRFLI